MVKETEVLGTQVCPNILVTVYLFLKYNLRPVVISSFRTAKLAVKLPGFILSSLLSDLGI